MTIDNPQRRSLLAAGSSLSLLPRALRAAAPDASPAGPPAARVDPVTDTYFGTTVTDPYRWMEDPADRDWMPFIRSQGAYARRVLDAIPGRAALLARTSELSGSVDIVASVQVGGPWVFIEKRPAGAANFRLYVRRGLVGAERLLIDPETRTRGDVHYAMNYWAASPDGRHVAYGMSPSGSEYAVVEILETSSGRVLPERIDRAPYGAPSWLPDGSGFFLHRLAEGAREGTTDFYKNSVAWLHRLGTDPAQDVKALARGQFPDVDVQDIDFPTVVAVPGSDHVIGLLSSGVQRELTLYVAPLASAKRGAGGWKRVCTPADKVVGFALRADELWLVTEQDAPRGRIVLATTSRPAFASAREVVPQGPLVLRGISAGRDAVYVQAMEAGLGRLLRIGAHGASRTAPAVVKLPFEGALTFVYADPRRDGALVALESWVRPAEILDVPPAGAPRATRLARKPPVDVSSYDSIETFATAKDGMKVPVSIVFRKGLPRDGSAPTMIDAYGAYAVTSDPYFGPRFIAWLERGGVWATAHVRGGGEYGREWHEAGKLLTKPNTWRDLIAAAEMLVAERWTSPARLSIRGGSAGGITVGRALTERPDLFSAVISEVGVSNALRAEFSQNGPPNIPEFGTVTEESGFRALYEMDAYQHVKDGVPYPAVLLTTGLTDPRVSPWEAAKMAARLQKATSSGKPVLLRIEEQAGHGIGSTRQQRDEETADVFAFALWQAGLARG